MNSQYQNNPHEDQSNSRPKGENRESSLSLQQRYHEIVTGRIPGSQMVSLRIPAAEAEGKGEERTRGGGGQKGAIVN